MEYKEIAKGIKIPVLGVGTWGMGGKLEPDYSRDEEEIHAIQEAIKLGCTLIDTAEMYGAGHSEELVGKAIKKFNREDLFIVTKVIKTNLRYDDLINSAKNSLKRLDIDQIDLYLIHAPNFDIPIEETMRAMDELVEQGLVRFIGVSNFTVDQMKKAQAVSKNKIVVNQIEYSLLTRNKGDYNNSNMESETVPYCQENDTIIMAERPVERGILTRPGIPILDEIAKKYGKTQAQVAINWLISQKNVITIPKASNLAHIKDNLGALGWKLEQEDFNKLSSLKL